MFMLCLTVKELNCHSCFCESYTCSRCGLGSLLLSSTWTHSRRSGNTCWCLIPCPGDQPVLASSGAHPFCPGQQGIHQGPATSTATSYKTQAPVETFVGKLIALHPAFIDFSDTELLFLLTWLEKTKGSTPLILYSPMEPFCCWAS